MGAEGCILALMVAGVPASVAFFIWAALRSGHDCTSLRPIWIVLSEGRQDEDGGRDDWGGGGGWPPGPPFPSGGAIETPGGECRREPKRERTPHCDAHKPRKPARVTLRHRLES